MSRPSKKCCKTPKRRHIFAALDLDVNLRILRGLVPPEDYHELTVEEILQALHVDMGDIP